MLFLSVIFTSTETTKLNHTKKMIKVSTSGCITKKLKAESQRISCLQRLKKIFSFGSKMKIFIWNVTCPKHVNRNSGSSCHVICQRGVKKFLCVFYMCDLKRSAKLLKEIKMEGKNGIPHFAVFEQFMSPYIPS